jgi:hypothetical protein
MNAIDRLRQHLNRKVEENIKAESDKLHEQCMAKVRRKYDGKKAVLRVSTISPNRIGYGDRLVRMEGREAMDRDIEKMMAPYNRFARHESAAYIKGQELMREIDKVELRATMKDPRYAEMLVSLMEKIEKL